MAPCSRWLLVLICAAPLLRADLTYQRSVRVTGGTALRLLRGTPSGDRLSDAAVTTLRLRGNKLARRSGQYEELFDLDARTVTLLDHAHKQYTVTSFDDYRAAHPAPARSAPAPEIQAESQAYSEERKFSAVEAREVLIHVTLELGTDTEPKPPLEFSAETWVAAEAPGWPVLAEAAHKLADALGVDVLSVDLPVTLKPQALLAMRRLNEETLKLQGAVLEQNIRIDGPAASALDPQAERKVAQQEARRQAGEQALSKLGRGLGAVLRGGAGGAIANGPAGNVPVPDKSPIPKIGGASGASDDDSGTTATLILRATTQQYNNAELADADFAVPAGYQREFASAQHRR
jgi:hypothetical protein